MLPTMFDNPFFNITSDGDSRAPSKALYRWERIKKAISQADEQIAVWEKHKSQLLNELEAHKTEAREVFKELME